MRLIACAAVVLTVGVCSAQSAPPATQPLVIQPVPLDLAAVTTIDELAAQPTIRTRLGPTHLGIDTATPLAYGNVTLYLLLDLPAAPAPRGPGAPAGFNEGIVASIHPASQEWGAFSPVGAGMPGGVAEGSRDAGMGRWWRRAVRRRMT